jgi:hypothetical protein
LLLLLGGAILILLGVQKPTAEPATVADKFGSTETMGRKMKGGTQVARTKRVFIAFAKEDERIRDLIKGQSLNAASPFEYVDMSVKEPYSSAWKEQVRIRIRGSDGVIALLSKASLKAEGELWEIQCATAERKPLLGLYIYKDDQSTPSAMGGAKCIVWSWDGIAGFINGL